MVDLDLDADLRRLVYDVSLQHGAPPSISQLTTAVGRSTSDVRTALQRLAAARVLVLQPGSDEILMAPPFSAVPTPFVVHTARHTSFANCAWDALGVPVMMRTPARIESACACCGAAMRLEADGDATPAGAGVIHFAVPAQRWWHDIVFT
jgi:hypothetical protein